MRESRDFFRRGCLPGVQRLLYLLLNNSYTTSVFQFNKFKFPVVTPPLDMCMACMCVGCVSNSL